MTTTTGAQGSRFFSGTWRPPNAPLCDENSATLQQSRTLMMPVRATSNLLSSSVIQVVGAIDCFILR